MAGIGIWQLLIVLAIMLLLFGSKRLRSLSSDLGTIRQEFKNTKNDDVRPDADSA